MPVEPPSMLVVLLVYNFYVHEGVACGCSARGMSSQWKLVAVVMYLDYWLITAVSCGLFASARISGYCGWAAVRL